MCRFEAEQAVVRRIKAARGQDWTLQQIADDLNADGVPTKTGAL